MTKLLDATNPNIYEPVDENEFDAFGNGGENEYSRIGYTGQYHDAETGFVYLRARYYNPAIGRFINEDPIRDGLNWYVYCDNNPVNFVDPSGMANIALGLAGWGGASAADGILPFGEIIGGLFFVVCLFIPAPKIEPAKPLITPYPEGKNISIATTASSIDAKTIDITTTSVEDGSSESDDNQAYFPTNPYNFYPKGLVLKEYPGSNNGKIIKWQDPVNKTTIFEWDEDFEAGSHYHIVVNEEHTGDHILAGTPVPFPYNIMFFGE